MTTPRRLITPHPQGRLPAAMLRALAAEMSDPGRFSRAKAYARDGAVIDFIDPVAWPAFNLADIAIVVGILGVVYVAEGGRDD